MISCRQSDLFKKLKDLEKSKLINITGYNNYTPEVLSQLNKMGYIVKKNYDENGVVWYGSNNRLHRINGPALEYSNGSKYWYLNGKAHRENGPAIEFSNGSKFWLINNKKHREDGPAVDDIDGTKEWWLNDKEYTEEEYNKLTPRKRKAMRPR